MHWKEKLRIRWKLKSVKQVPWILLVFALTGSSVIEVALWTYRFIPLERIDAGWMRFLAKTAVMLLEYQLLLLFFGLITGQWSFFSNFVANIFIRPFRKSIKS